MLVDNFNPFIGQHCETTATGSLLKQLGIEFSEPMLFGIGEGLGYIFWKMKMMQFPFIGGRVKPDLLTENICRNLQLDLQVKETSSIKKAWTNVETELAMGNAVGLKLDCYHLDYFTTKIHFAGHYVAMYGYDEDMALLLDTAQQGSCVQTSLENLEKARNEKGPMSSKNKSYTIAKTATDYDLSKVVKKALHNNTVTYLNPPITNLYYKGINKTASELKKWFDNSKDIKTEFTTSAMLMERAGTGGALFRNFYRDFLHESYDLLRIEGIKKAHLEFKEIAQGWTNVSELFNEIGETASTQPLQKTMNILRELSSKEKAAMDQIAQCCS